MPPGPSGKQAGKEKGGGVQWRMDYAVGLERNKLGFMGQLGSKSPPYSNIYYYEDRSSSLQSCDFLLLVKVRQMEGREGKQLARNASSFLPSFRPSIHSFIAPFICIAVVAINRKGKWTAFDSRNLLDLDKNVEGG